MKQVLNRQSRVTVEDVPAPVMDENKVLVRVCYSCISAGTELASLKNPTHALNKQPAAPRPTGYSASGIVLKSGNKIKDTSSITKCNT